MDPGSLTPLTGLLLGITKVDPDRDSDWENNKRF